MALSRGVGLSPLYLLGVTWSNNPVFPLCLLFSKGLSFYMASYELNHNVQHFIDLVAEEIQKQNGTMLK